MTVWLKIKSQQIDSCGCTWGHVGWPEPELTHFSDKGDSKFLRLEGKQKMVLCGETEKESGSVVSPGDLLFYFMSW